MGIEQSDKKGIQYIVASLAALGVSKVVICPGSRNAPLTISFNRHPQFSCTSIRDERSAAFVALGMAAECKEPVVVVCTSGSAALNFAPAVAEAFYQRIPLIVVTADRPKAWTGQGDGQTINQTNVFANYIRKFYELDGDATNADELWMIQRAVSEGMAVALHRDRGPVHFNIPVGEPLYGTQKLNDLPVRVHRCELPVNHLSELSGSNYGKTFSRSKRVMILAGQMPGDAHLQQQLAELSNLSNVVVLTETTSNLHHPTFIQNIDRCITALSADDEIKFAPDLLITIGGAVISKRIKGFIRKNKPLYHWNVNAFDASMDTYQSLTDAIYLPPAGFFSQLQTDSGSIQSDYALLWKQLNAEKQQLHHNFLAKAPFSDLRAFQEIFNHIPNHYAIHFSNSSPIRYGQLFSSNNTWAFYCNRGTSGIDGCTSTAVGTAFSNPERKFLLITGDVAFWYDINGLWNELPTNNLKIILINNSGGNIFRIIPGPDTIDERETFFETKMTSDAAKLSAHFNWSYLAEREGDNLVEALHRLFHSESRCILEIFTDAETSAETLKQYWRYLNQKLS